MVLLAWLWMEGEYRRLVRFHFGRFELIDLRNQAIPPAYPDGSPLASPVGKQITMLRILARCPAECTLELLHNGRVPLFFLLVQPLKAFLRTHGIRRTT